MFNGQNEDKEVKKDIEAMEEEKTEKSETKQAVEKPEKENKPEIAEKEPETASNQTEENKPETKKPSEKKKENDMMSLMDEYFDKFKAREIVEGQVVNVDEREILVDIGYKSESAISTREFSPDTIPELGEKIKVYIESVEDGSGRLKLSKKKADFYLNINILKEKMKNNETVEGVLKRRVKGGMI
ncbi:MAG: S1 RNA-binding domain-containing protein, partial [Candidatus Cloacimonadota bacterium]|nr:S1 RNA-binding domain-containing protein [Candidatus Cloacimonadota bacterium]